MKNKNVKKIKKEEFVIKDKKNISKINIWLYIVIATILLSFYPIYKNYIYCFTDNYEEDIYSDVLNLSSDHIKLLKESHEIFKNDENDLRWYIYNVNYIYNVFHQYTDAFGYYLPNSYNLDRIKEMNYPINLEFLSKYKNNTEVSLDSLFYYDTFYDFFKKDKVDYKSFSDKLLMSEGNNLIEIKRDDVLNIFFDEENIVYILEFVTIILILIYLFNVKFVNYKKEIKNISILFIIIYILNIIYDVVFYLICSGTYHFSISYLLYMGNVGYVSLFGFIIIFIFIYFIKLLLNIKIIKKTNK